jgi:release factor glutamine methyltransferase
VDAPVAVSPLTVRTAQALGRRQLAAVETPGLDTDLLLGLVLGRGREALFGDDLQTLTVEQDELFRRLVQERAGGVPVAYLTGTKCWFGIDLAIDRSVLIPRSETETLVELAIERVRVSGVRRVLDVGTGSGAIAVALAVNLPDLQVIATDVSEDALAVAAMNVGRHSVERQVRLMRSDLLDAVDEQPDLIVANLPYIPVTDRESLSAEVQQEPAGALFGGDDGLALVRRLIAQVAKRGWSCDLILELDPRQAETVGKIVAGQLPRYAFATAPDLSGGTRFVVLIGQGREP